MTSIEEVYRLGFKINGSDFRFQWTEGQTRSNENHTELRILNRELIRIRNMKIDVGKMIVDLFNWVECQLPTFPFEFWFCRDHLSAMHIDRNCTKPIHSLCDHQYSDIQRERQNHWKHGIAKRLWRKQFI